MTVSLRIALTVFQISWSALWGGLHVQLRKKRGYARDRTAVGRLDGVYRRLNPLLFLAQLGLSVACLWSEAPWLLEFHHWPELRSLGALLLGLSLALTFLAVRHLAGNYSPCYDTHLPRTLTTSGPYALIRHPMYLAKFLAGMGTVLLTGSIWLLPSTIYLWWVTGQAVRREERELTASLPGYGAYRARTRRLIPGIF